jgi:GNAT superfamily N-acetyltransferase
MPQRLPRRHLQTFARLRLAASTDVTALEMLEHAVPAAEREDWSALMAEPDATVITAHEGDSLVGAILLRHRAGAASARICWLAVCPSGRHRGVGTLLLDAASSAADDAGAAVLTAEAPAANGAFTRLLASAGFECRRGRDETNRFKRLLRRQPWPDTVLRLR